MTGHGIIFCTAAALHTFVCHSNKLAGYYSVTRDCVCSKIEDVERELVMILFFVAYTAANLHLLPRNINAALVM
jgi:hypothetical protein